MIDRANGCLRSAKSTIKSYKTEIRLIQDVAKRRNYEQRIGQLSQQLNTLTADCRALEAETERGELFVDGGGGPERPSTNGGMDPTKTGDAMLKEAHGLQDKTADSLQNTKHLIEESKKVGATTLETLQIQRETIGRIEIETDRVDGNLARSEGLLKQFGKRMASDHFIQCFAIVNCLLFVGVLMYAIWSGKDLNPIADPDSPVEDAAAGTGRALLKYGVRYLRTRLQEDASRHL